NNFEFIPNVRSVHISRLIKRLIDRLQNRQKRNKCIREVTPYCKKGY
ncbi:hypothetical protein NT04LM_4493, partial [Listeria monocytogenes FSL F2-208]